ncbi:hypothetical protein HPB50_001906 [Hyalomma asiaticum]|uniref:Uncharacterized protein n=1 Tax=Hyalomma asiaticum TaxID=266040 RepID=A0ACB7TAQ1_HYAAI|nr:hypothetical protein HPB50_001906 [Hyalomma asiaticum]
MEESTDLLPAGASNGLRAAALPSLVTLCSGCALWESSFAPDHGDGSSCLSRGQDGRPARGSVVGRCSRRARGAVSPEALHLARRPPPFVINDESNGESPRRRTVVFYGKTRKFRPRGIPFQAVNHLTTTSLIVDGLNRQSSGSVVAGPRGQQRETSSLWQFPRAISPFFQRVLRWRARKDLPVRRRTAAELFLKAPKKWRPRPSDVAAADGPGWGDGGPKKCQGAAVKFIPRSLSTNLSERGCAKWVKSKVRKGKKEKEKASHDYSPVMTLFSFRGAPAAEGDRKRSDVHSALTASRGKLDAANGVDSGWLQRLDGACMLGTSRNMDFGSVVQCIRQLHYAEKWV